MTVIHPWQAIVLGVVEGLTEFLPVSSTAHLRITESLMGLPTADASVVGYTAVIQTGAIVAVIVYFFRDLWALASTGLSGLRDRQAREHEDFRLAWWIVAATVPLAAVGVLAKPLLDGPLASLWVVVGSLLIGSLYMHLADRRSARAEGRQELGFREAMLVGGSQVLALLLPGFSRSGASISTGLLVGLDRTRATRVSFLFSVPALTGAGLVELKDASASGDAGTLALGVVVAFVVAYAAIAWLLRFVARHTFTRFVLYRVVLALGLALALAAGAVPD